MIKNMRKIVMAALVFALVIAMALPLTAEAYDYYDSDYSNNFESLGVSDDSKHVFDGAMFYSESELNLLESRCKEISKEFNTDVVIATIRNYSGYIDDAVTEIEYARYGSANTQCANMLIIDIASRDIRIESIEGSKSNDNWMESTLCQYIYDKIKSDFSNADYYEGTDMYLDLLEKYLPANSSYNPGSILNNPLFHLGIAIVISAIIVASQVAGSGGKVTVDQKSYLTFDNEHKVDTRDIFLRKTVSKTRIQSSSSGGGGGRSGGGGGGRGSGGGKF